MPLSQGDLILSRKVSRTRKALSAGVGLDLSAVGQSSRGNHAAGDGRVDTAAGRLAARGVAGSEADLSLCGHATANVLRAVDPDQLNHVLMALLTRGRSEKREPGEQEHGALDGKTVRGTQNHLAEDQRKMHHVNLYEIQTGVTLKEDLRLFFQEPPVDCQYFRTGRTCESSHRRLEMREIVASTELNDFLATSWPGTAQVFRLRRRICKKLSGTQEWVYGFTSLSPVFASPERLLQLSREHWAIENRLHRRRDVTLGEDACQVRKGIAPRTLAVLNSFLLAVFDWLEVRNVASQMRIFAANPFLALRLFIGSLISEN